MHARAVTIPMRRAVLKVSYVKFGAGTSSAVHDPALLAHSPCWRRRSAARLHSMHERHPSANCTPTRDFTSPLCSLDTQNDSVSSALACRNSSSEVNIRGASLPMALAAVRKSPSRMHAWASLISAKRASTNSPYVNLCFGTLRMRATFVLKVVSTWPGI
eukprot:6179876-Pleurochrysis_carterae.AAC.10